MLNIFGGYIHTCLSLITFIANDEATSTSGNPSSITEANTAGVNRTVGTTLGYGRLETLIFTLGLNKLPVAIFNSELWTMFISIGSDCTAVVLYKTVKMLSIP